MRILGLQQAAHLQQVTDASLQILHRERLFDIGISTAIHALRLAAVVGLRRQHDKRNMTEGGILANPSAELGAIHLRHHPVAHYQRYGRMQLQLAQALHAILCREHQVIAGKVRGDKLAHICIVFHNEHRRLRLFAARSTGAIQSSGSIRIHAVAGSSPIAFSLLGLITVSIHHLTGKVVLFVLAHHGILLADRQRNHEAGSPAHFRFHLHRAMMSLHQVLHDVQTDARARLVVLRLIEGREDFLLLIGSDAIAIIRHHDAEMLTVCHVAAQAHVVLRVFVGIRHQVADYLGYRLLVDDGSEIVLRIIHLQLGSVLPQGWLKPLHHGGYQLRDVLKLEVYLHSALLHLVEVEQLVHQVQQSLRIPVNHVDGIVHHLSFPSRNTQLRPFALQVLQRTDDERNRGSDFVGYHGEELQSGIAHLLLLLLLQRIKFMLMATLLTLQSALGIEIDGVAQQQQIEQLGWQGPPERRMHLYLQLRLLLAPYTIIVGCLHPEGVTAIRQIGVGGTMLMRGGPLLVKAFEHVGILVLFGRYIAQRRKRDVDDIVIIREVQLVDVSKRLRQFVGTYLHMLVEEFERSDRHRRSHMIDLYLIRKESIEALGGSEIHATIRSQ